MKNRSLLLCFILLATLAQAQTDRFYYPDVVLECASADDEWVVRSPCFVVEVTSPSTRATDLREKAVAYRSVPTVRGYLLVEQKRRRVILYSRGSSGEAPPAPSWT